MKQIIFTIPLLCFAILFTACKSDSDVLARYKYGTVTRAEYNQRADKDSKKKIDPFILESLCVEGVALHEALAGGYDKDEVYMMRLERQTGQILSKAVTDKTGASIEVKTEYVKCRHLPFKGEDAADIARKVISLLRNGEKFDSLAKSYSSNPERAVEQSTVYVVKGGGRPEFEGAAFSLAEGAFSSEPLMLPDGTAVVLIADEKGIFTNKDIEKITPVQERRRLSALLGESSYSNLISHLEKTHRASYKGNPLPAGDDTVIFTVSGKDYTMKDLKRRRDVFSKIIMEPLEGEPFLAGFAREWYLNELFKIEADKKGYLKEKETAAEIKRTAQFILANDYMRFLGEKDAVVTEKELLDEYNKNKKNYMRKAESKSGKPVQLSFNEAKPFIRKNFIQTRGAIKSAEWKKRALAESGFVMAE